MNRPNLNLQAAFSICALAFAFALAACDQLTNQPKTETARGWDIPTDPQEKAAYDYAHSLKLPDSVPKPVPFDFKEAGRKAKMKDGKSVSDQYFEHLCKTEAGEYIFKTVENVEGVFQMRPNPIRYGSPIDYDRYAMEAPILMQAVDYDNQGNFHSGRYFVQPMFGRYLFLEQPKPGDANKVIRLVRRENSDPPSGYRNGYPTSVPGKYGWGFRLPFMVVIEESDKRQARYGFTWRGIKRERDREQSIGGGEYLMVDMETNELMGIKRDFVLSGRDKNTSSGIWWGNARPCGSKAWAYRDPVEKIIKPISGLNNPYIPENFQREIKGETK